MMHDFLYQRLDRVAVRQRSAQLGWQLAACWAGAALLGWGLVLVQRQFGLGSRFTWIGLSGLALAASIVLWRRNRRHTADYRELAVKIEQAHPDLQGVLLTAVQQTHVEGVEPGYLQYRVLQTAVERSQQSDWRDIVPRSRFVWAYLAQVVALAMLALVVASLYSPAARKAGAMSPMLAGISVTPGNIELERGESLVVLAKFGGSLPASVDLVLSEDNSPTRKQPLVKSLADPIFGGSVPEVKADLVYHLEYGGQRTPDYKVTVFEHPRLERANVQLTFPSYTSQPPKRIEDSRRVSAVEGTKVGLSLQLNKPVKSARLVAHDKAKTVIELTVSPDKALASLPEFVPTTSQTYDLKLVDAEDRPNKVATPFVIEVLPNRPPEIKLTTPRGDTRPSALEEVAFDGTVWDDFGTPSYGLAYTLAGGETKFIELGKEAPAKEKRGFNHVMRLEELGVQPDQLLSWYVWADDVGPDGKIRRTNGDLFFAEVRPFDEVFKESQDAPSSEQQQQMQGGGPNTPARKLTELQKQIISATWKLQRDPLTPKYPDDASVVFQSQEQAIDQANEAAEKASDPRQQALWKTATTKMEEASVKLKSAAKSQAPLAQALTSEQSAYQALLKLQQREYNVSRSRNRSGGGGGQGGNQQQIDQLDLQQAENRYETQRQATPPQSPERREQSQVMNRLQELAHRQGDLNDRMKELQTALQEARSDPQKEEIRRQLKRLQEEQRQMLADLDELKQRMDRPENQSRMSEQRKQLDQTRDQLQQAADAAASGSVAQAVSSGTRAQRQLQDMRHELRKQSSSQFSEDLRQMRSDARELTRQEEEISRQMGTAGAETTQRKSLGSATNDQNLLDQLAKQKERMKSLVDRASEVSQQAETAEPLVSKQLYDSVRKLNQEDVKTMKDARRDLLEQGVMTRDLYTRMEKSEASDDSGKSLDLTSDLLRAGFLPQAGQAERRARESIDDLRRGVEKAAGSVLGDDEEALKLAQSEIDSVTEQLKKEMAQDQGQGSGQPGDPSQSQPGGQPSANGQQMAGQGGDPSQSGQGEPGVGGQPSEQLAGGEKESPEGQPSGPAGGEKGQKQGGRLASKGGQSQGKGETSQSKSGQSPGQAAAGDSSQQASSAEPGQNGDSPEQKAGKAGSSAGGQSRNGRSQLAQSDSASAGQDSPGASSAPANGAQAGDRNRSAANNRGQQSSGPQSLSGNARDPRTGNDRAGFDVSSAFNQNNANNGSGGSGGNFNWDGNMGAFNGPILGNNFGPWADRLRNVEDVLDDATLRESVAAARERARQLRVDYRRDLKKPDWAVVQLQVLKPLLEVRNRISEELARRDSKDSLVPIDRDPVPTRYTESVAKYYESLSKENAEKPGSQ